MLGKQKQVKHPNQAKRAYKPCDTWIYMAYASSRIIAFKATYMLVFRSTAQYSIVLGVGEPETVTPMIIAWLLHADIYRPSLHAVQGVLLGCELRLFRKQFLLDIVTFHPWQTHRLAGDVWVANRKTHAIDRIGLLPCIFHKQQLGPCRSIKCLLSTWLCLYKWHSGISRNSHRQSPSPQEPPERPSANTLPWLFQTNWHRSMEDSQIQKSSQKWIWFKIIKHPLASKNLDVLSSKVLLPILRQKPCNYLKIPEVLLKHARIISIHIGFCLWTLCTFWLVLFFLWFDEAGRVKRTAKNLTASSKQKQPRHLLSNGFEWSQGTWSFRGHQRCRSYTVLLEMIHWTWVLECLGQAACMLDAMHVGYPGEPASSAALPLAKAPRPQCEPYVVDGGGSCFAHLLKGRHIVFI